MLFANEQMTSQMGTLLEEGRRYWKLQKEYLGLHLAEILTRLLSSIALVLILILVGSMVLLFASFAIAYWLAEVLGSTLLGFGIIALVLLLIALLVYANRINWIVVPTTRFMVGLLASSLPVPTQEGITMQKNHLQEQLEDNRQDLKETASNMLAPMPEARNGWENAAIWFQHGLNIYRGIQLGASAVVVFRNLFKIGRKKKK